MGDFFGIRPVSGVELPDLALRLRPESFPPAVRPTPSMLVASLLAEGCLQDVESSMVSKPTLQSLKSNSRFSFSLGLKQKSTQHLTVSALYISLLAVAFHCLTSDEHQDRSWFTPPLRELRVLDNV